MDVDGEVALLVRKITELGQKDATDGNMRVKYGVLFRETSDDFEALAGTMRAAKKKVGLSRRISLKHIYARDAALLLACSTAFHQRLHARIE